MHRTIFSIFLTLVLTTSALAQFSVENPLKNSKQSGVGLVSGWKCTGTNLTAVIDGVFTLALTYGSQRNDTQGACGDTNNGFGLLVNWNLLPNGTHTIRFYDGGAEFASAAFTVQTLGQPFYPGLSKSVEVPNFPSSGQTTRLEWQESSQNFVIAGLSTTGGGYPNVAGQWRTSLDFVTETCNFISMPGDLPSHLSNTLTVFQSDVDLTVQSGTITLTGDLEPNGDFTIISPPEVAGETCIFALGAGFAGNFLEGNLVFALVYDRVGGSCTGVSLPCTVAWAGTITRISGNAALQKEEEMSLSIQALREKARQAFERFQ